MCAKIIAEQVPPEFQESHVWHELDYGMYEGLVIHGNRDFKGYAEDTIEGAIIKFCEEWNGIADLDDGFFVDGLENLLDDLEIDDEKERRQKIEEVYGVLRFAEAAPRRWELDELLYCRALDILVGGEWKYESGCGIMQSEWQGFYYNYSMYDCGIEWLITGYWNEGSEWVCWEEGCEDDYTNVYCYKWDDDEIKKEIMNAMGGDEVELRKFAGWTRLPNYVTA